MNRFPDSFAKQRSRGTGSRPTSRAGSAQLQICGVRNPRARCAHGAAVHGACRPAHSSGARVQGKAAVWRQAAGGNHNNSSLPNCKQTAHSCGAHRSSKLPTAAAKLPTAAANCPQLRPVPPRPPFSNRRSRSAAMSSGESQKWNWAPLQCKSQAGGGGQGLCACTQQAAEARDAHRGHVI